MKLEQRIWTDAGGWSRGGELAGAQLVFLFGSRDVFAGARAFTEIRESYPHAFLFGCSTAGEICGTRVLDDSLVSTAVELEHSSIYTASVAMSEVDGSLEAGRKVASKLPSEGLVHVFVISDGQEVNGSELVRGMLGELPEGVQVTGGLAGDGARFEKTLVIANEEPMSGVVSAVGLYGDRLKIGYGSLGGWDSFGPERKVTRAEGNVLYELDGKPALELYKTYLGEHAEGLPATGLLFPLSIRNEDGEDFRVRTILAVDEKEQSLTFAGDVPEGVHARLMKANFERLIDGASGAAKSSYETLRGSEPDFAVLISCVGRKLVLKQRTEEEVEGVQAVLGDGPVLTGFYSYGEICPAAPGADCELHNQTMTITTFSER